MTGNPNAPAFATPSYNSPAGGGNVSTHLDITSGTLVKATSGSVIKCSVISSGSAAGSINDTTVVSGASVSNQVATIPNAVQVLDIGMPFQSGIVVVPGSGQTLAVSFE